MARSDFSEKIRSYVVPTRSDAANSDDIYAASMIDGFPITVSGADAILAEMDRTIKERSTCQSISITNTESMYHAHRDAAHAEFLKTTDFSVCDGVGVVVAGWAWGHRIRRLNGPELFLLACEYGQSRGWRHFFYGGRDSGALDLLVERLKQRFPDLIVCGTYCPPFGPLTDEEREVVLHQLGAVRADIVWVGLGLLKQERWIAEALGKTDTPWMVGIGAAFDYYAGTIPRAPAPMRAIGLEWLFRLVIQPKLRAKRYWWSLVWSVQAVAKGVLTGRFRHPTGRVGRPRAPIRPECPES